jgi:hypothetical protein
MMEWKGSTMPLEDTPSIQFLLELYRLTQGDDSVKVFIEDVGAAAGLDKESAGKIAENLIGEGWVEIKTLSGGIGITAEGVEAARAAGGFFPVAETDLNFGKGPVLDPDGRTAVDALTDDIKRHLSETPVSYPEREEMIMDLKTLEIQMTSPHPKTAIVREIFRSLKGSLHKSGATLTAQRIADIIDND